MEETTRRSILAAVLALACGASVVPGRNVEAQFAGIYTFANDGSYFSAHGDSQWWNLDWNTGYCGGPYWPGCSAPYNVRWTWTNGTFVNNWGRWDNPNSAQWADVATWIPATRGTTNQAPYTVNTSGGSRRTYIAQISYSDAWVSVDTLYDIRSVDLGDNTGESPNSTDIAWDEIYLSY